MSERRRRWMPPRNVQRKAAYSVPDLETRYALSIIRTPAALPRNNGRRPEGRDRLQKSESPPEGRHKRIHAISHCTKSPSSIGRS